MANGLDTRRSGVAGGVMLLGLGALLISGWWWPGILVVIGIALAAERLLEGRYGAAGVIAVLFIGIPLAISGISKIDIPWTWLIAFVLVGLGLSSIVKALSGKN